MRVIADLHFHSKYSRAVSPKMIIPEIIKWANYKGLNLVGTSDFTHPLWFSELKQNLEPLGNGLLKPKNQDKPRFILSTEISSIYSQGGKVRKVHTVVLAPNFQTVEKINEQLGSIGNLYSDGRPILGLSAKDLARIVLDINPRCMIIPAHMWTPWFSIFGANSGFNSIKECYKELTPYIFAGETELSSDPEMNWRLSMLDDITLMSNSDAHSPVNLGREANVFEVESRDYDYDYIYEIIKSKNPNYFSYTIEFYPEEGKYHFDGHRNCDGLKMKPTDSIKNKNICLKCNRPLTIGVLHQVEELADRPENYKPKNFPGSRHLVPLQEIISEAKNVGKTSKLVQEEYLRIVQSVVPEFSVLLDLDKNRLKENIDPRIVEGIINVRKNKIKAIPGYDGIYGKIKIFDDKNKNIENKKEQKSFVLKFFSKNNQHPPQFLLRFYNKYYTSRIISPGLAAWSIFIPT